MYWALLFKFSNSFVLCSVPSSSGPIGITTGSFLTTLRITLTDTNTALDPQVAMEDILCNYLLPNTTSCPNAGEPTIEMDLGNDVAKPGKTAGNIGHVVPGHTDLEPPLPLRATGTENGYALYPTLPPWGHNNRFNYDKWGQLSVQTKFEKPDLQEYLYNHPLREKLIIWIQRQPIKSNSLYWTHYGSSCRYRQCRPKKGNNHTIAMGHYRIAIDELTGIFPDHQADTYIHAAFFHISCFEEMLDLAQITRDFNVLCEDRKVVNAPNGAKRPNRMLLETRRVPNAIKRWLERAKEDPNWATTKTEDTLNYLAFTQKFSLRPHRRKCTDVPGMEKLGRDISYLGAPRPVAPNSIWGGKRVKGLTVVQLAANEGREYRGPFKGKKRAQSWVEEQVESNPRPVRRARLRSPVGDEEDPVVLVSPQTQSPINFQKSAVRNLRRETFRALPQRQCGSARECSIPLPRPAQRKGSQLPEHILNASALPPGTIIRTAGGEFLRHPITGMLEPILSVTIMDPYQHADGYPGTTPIPNPHMSDTRNYPNIKTPLIDPELRALATQVNPTSDHTKIAGGTSDEPVDRCDESLFGDSPPRAASPARLQFKCHPRVEDPEDLGSFDIEQYRLYHFPSQGMGCNDALVPTHTDTETLDWDKILQCFPTPGASNSIYPNNTDGVDFTDFDWPELIIP